MDTRGGWYWVSAIRRAGVITALGATAIAGCERAANHSPASAPVAPPSNAHPISAGWSRAEAAGKLADESEGLAAALRLVELAELDAALLRDPVPAQLRRISDDLWAIGVAEDSNLLRAPLFIHADGEVTAPIEFADPNTLRLYVSSDAEVFPHLLLLPELVRLVSGGERSPLAIVLLPEQPVALALRHERGFPYISVVLIATQDEVAFYRWDPFERDFMGPAADKLPDPPGGRWAADLSACLRLIPVGGELAEPETRPALPPQRPPVIDDDLLPA